MDNCNIQNPNFDNIKQNSKFLKGLIIQVHINHLRFNEKKITEHCQWTSFRTLTKRLEQEDATNN